MLCMHCLVCETCVSMVCASLLGVTFPALHTPPSYYCTHETASYIVGKGGLKCWLFYHLGSAKARHPVNLTSICIQDRKTSQRIY